jgi:anti-anti-sigma regulatory factor
MGTRVSAVTVKQLPETMNVKRGRIFFTELESCMNIDHPCIVLNCSKVRQMDRSLIHLLLCCLEEAMKRNGDVRLAAIPEGARATLELAGVDRLFQIFDSNADAEDSFRRVPLCASTHRVVPDGSSQTAERAA